MHDHDNRQTLCKIHVLRSMKKDKVYTRFLVMTSIGTVLKTHCQCPAGIDDRCNQVAATLFELEQRFKGIQNTGSDTEESSPSKSCKWDVPGKRKDPVVPIFEMSFVKHDYAKEKKVMGPSLTSQAAQQTTCASDQRTCLSERLNKCHEALKE